MTSDQVTGSECHCVQSWVAPIFMGLGKRALHHFGVLYVQKAHGPVFSDMSLICPCIYVLQINLISSRVVIFIYFLKIYFSC